MSNTIKITSGDSVNVKATTSAPNTVQISQGQTTNISIPNSRSVGKADAHYVHTQASPSATWTVNHGLSKRASVSVVDSAGTVIICDVSYVSDNQVVLTFDASTSGQAYLN